MKILLNNRRAFFDYEIIETFVAGIFLAGKEVKSLKSKRGKLEGAYAHFQGEEIFLINFSIPTYQPKNTLGEVDSDRTRKILLTKKEIKSLLGKIKEKKLTLLPLKVFTEKGRIKIELGLGRGKRKIDKRETIKKRESNIEIERAMKSQMKNRAFRS